MALDAAFLPFDRRRAMDDDALWEAFTNATLPEKDWTHHAHVRVAWLHSKPYGLDEAHLLMRVGVIRLNASHGLVETASRGYHETITRGWLLLVRALMRELSAPTSAAFVEMGGRRLERDALLQHYSRARLASLEARARFLEPDAAPLPG